MLEVDVVCLLHYAIEIGVVSYIYDHIRSRISLLLYTSPRQSQGRVLITKISYDYCDITGFYPTKDFKKTLTYKRNC